MCGIVGYIGPKEACPILINGLKRLEYRGYDSAGIALIHNNNIQVYKCKGRVQDLEHHMELEDTSATIGMGHTRWATHGEPNDANAHPHTSMKGLFSIVHNGIIENHALLKEKLEARGYSFKSETDTEVLANLIEYIYLKGQINAENAVRLALTKVIGAYGLVVLCKEEPDQLVVARKGSPLVIGVGQGGVDPAIMGMGPVPAIANALKNADIKLSDIDVIELNEAFAAQSLGVIHELMAQHGVTREWINERTNINGGAIALGHPIGASGNRIIVSLVYEMLNSEAKVGLASLCIGGGMGTALILKKC